MKKVYLSFALGLVAIFGSIYFFFSKSDLALERQMHRILSRLPKITQGVMCLSPYDCKMQVLPVDKCFPRDFLYTYSSKEPQRQEIESLIAEYKETFRLRYPDNNGKPRCLNELEPVSKCMEGKCLIQLKSGERYP